MSISDTVGSWAVGGEPGDHESVQNCLRSGNRSPPDHRSEGASGPEAQADAMKDGKRKREKSLLEELERVRARIVALEASGKEQERVAQGRRREFKLLKQMLSLYEQDRQLIACEIHDGFVQKTTAALVHLQSLTEHPEQQAGNVSSVLPLAIVLLQQSVEEARRLINGLEPTVLEANGLSGAIEQLVSEARTLDNFEVEFLNETRFGQLVPPLENAVFRIVQECLANALQHSGDRRAKVALSQAGNQVRLDIQDWGVGFDPESVQPGRFGLRGIRRRASALGGHAAIESQPGKGARIVVHLPLIQNP